MKEIEVTLADGWSEEDKAGYIAAVQKQHHESTFFVRACAPSPFHWHFQQALDALMSECYLPGVLGLLSGIEASIRTTIAEIERRPLGGDLGVVMSNRLIREADARGMAVDALAYPNEADFRAKLPFRDGVRVVELRNDVCHGNFQKFVQQKEGLQIFTPECLGPIAAQTLDVSYRWISALTGFRDRHGLKRIDSSDLDVPANPLARWLGD